MNQLHACCCIALMTTIAGAAVGGEINPPPGPIMPTMRSLDQIEPRVSVNDLPGSQTAVRVISQPGNYYLTADVVGEPGKSGVVVLLTADTDDDLVTIDLNGFSLTGVPGSLHGLDVPSNPAALVERVVVRQSPGQSGGARFWDGDGLRVTGADVCVFVGVHSQSNGGYGVSGANLSKADSKRALESLDVTNNGAGGVRFTNVRSVSLDGLDVRDNTGNGIEVTLSDAAGGAARASIENVVCTSNTGDGVRVVRLSGGVSGVVTTVRLRAGESTGNGGSGLAVFDSADASMSMSVDDFSASGNGGNGFTIRDTDARLRRCSASGNAGDGFALDISAGEPVKGVNVSIEQVPGGFSNGGSGVRATDVRLTLDALTLSGNNGDGLTATRSTVRASDVTAHSNGGDGLRLVDTGAELRRCSAEGNVDDGFDLSLSPGEPVGGVNISIEQGATVTNGGNGVRIDGPAVRLRNSVCSTNTLTGVRVLRGPLTLTSTTASRNGGAGLDDDDDGDGAVTRSEFSNNGGPGVVKTGGTLTVSGTLVVRNGLSPTGGDGVVCTDVTMLRVTDSTLRGNEGNGLHVSSPGGGRGTVITGSSVFEGNGLGASGGSGLRLLNVTGDLTVDGAVSSSNNGSGVVVESNNGVPGGRVTLRRVVTENNMLDGLSLLSSTGGEVRRCVLSGNGGVGLRILGAEHVVVENSAVSNSLGGFAVTTPGNSMGPVVDELSMPTNTNPGANYLR